MESSCCHVRSHRTWAFWVGQTGPRTRPDATLSVDPTARRTVLRTAGLQRPPPLWLTDFGQRDQALMTVQMASCRTTLHWHLAAPGNTWQHLEDPGAPGKTWQNLARPGSTWQDQAVPGRTWITEQDLELPGSTWQDLACVQSNGRAKLRKPPKTSSGRRTGHPPGLPLEPGSLSDAPARSSGLERSRAPVPAYDRRDASLYIPRVDKPPLPTMDTSQLRNLGSFG
ncbi:hypothetical protein VTK73DRAFT_3561 [Phialemonium thermophilum]|uniref:Uncharacterized protein n=1 Tax=Phialemonium thermophilum TaxID=223376 RepID=A0ABR3VI59_9PEZI